MSGSLTFNGTTAASLGLRIGAVNPYDGPYRERQTYIVPGRFGEVIPVKDNVYSVPNQIREYSAALYMRAAAPEAVERRMAEIREWLFRPSGYAELSDSYEPQFYRRAYFIGDVIPERKGAGQNFQIPLQFSCDPRRYIAGDHHFSMSGGGGAPKSYTTPETVNGFKIMDPAKPLIFISNGGEYMTAVFTDVTDTGSGPVNKQIGQLKLAGEAGDFWFDAENLTAYYEDGSPANEMVEDVVGEIRLGPGQTKIEIGTSLLHLTFYPRWWVR